MLKKPVIVFLSVFLLVQGLNIALADPGLSAYGKGSWKIYTDTNQINQIAFDVRGNAWLATGGGAVYYSVYGKKQIYTTLDGLASNKVRDVSIDREGNVWFATARGVSIRRSNGQWESYTEKNGLLTNDVWFVEAVADGSVWVAGNEGLNAWQNGKWTAYGRESGLPERWLSFRQVDVSSSGKVYITAGNRVWVLNNQGRFEPYAATQGMDEVPILNMLVDSKENLWLFTALGINQVKPDKKFSIYKPEFFKSFIVMDVTEDAQGNIWAVTGKEFLTFKSEQWEKTAYPSELEGKVVNRIKFDREGNLWLGIFSKETGGGAGLVAKIKGKWLSSYQVGPVGPDFTAATVDGQGNIWFGSTGRRLSIFRKDGTWSSRKIDGDKIYALTTDTLGNVWVSTSSHGTPWDDNWGGPIAWPTLNGDFTTVFRPDGSSKRFGSKELGGVLVSAIGAGPAGKVWFAANAASETIDPTAVALRRKDGT